MPDFEVLGIFHSLPPRFAVEAPCYVACQLHVLLAICSYMCRRATSYGYQRALGSDQLGIYCWILILDTWLQCRGYAFHCLCIRAKLLSLSPNCASTARGPMQLIRHQGLLRKRRLCRVNPKTQGPNAQHSRHHRSGPAEHDLVEV